MPLIDPQHVMTLKSRSVKVDEDDLVFTIQAPTGIKTDAGIVFLQKGNAKAGWQHICKHQEDFQVFGLEGDKLRGMIYDMLAKEPHKIGTPSGGAGTLATYVVDAGKGNFDLNIVIASNGFIVTAHPYAMTASAYYGAVKASTGLGGLAGYVAHQ